VRAKQSGQQLPPARSDIVEIQVARYDANLNLKQAKSRRDPVAKVSEAEGRAISLAR
jgi:hypothetical protein